MRKKSQFASFEKAELPPLFWERPSLIKIDTYFQDFPNPPTQLKQLLFFNPTTVWHCLRQTDRNQFPHLYNSFDLAEKRSPHVLAVCCFLLWQFSFIQIQPAFNAFIVHCLNLPKEQNANSAHKCHTTIWLSAFHIPFVFTFDYSHDTYLARHTTTKILFSDWFQNFRYDNILF